MTDSGWQLAVTQVTDAMTLEQASFVELLRVDCEHGWRVVAERFYGAFPNVAFGDEPAGRDQFVGMVLCRAASHLLGRTID